MLSKGQAIRFVALTILAIVGVAGRATAASFVFPTGAQAQVQTVVNIDGTVSPSPATQTISLVNPGTSTSSSLSGASGSGQAEVDLLSGILRAESSTNAGFTTIANGWEFVTFSGNGTVSFSYDVDGTLSNLKSPGLVVVEPSVRIFDVTTWTSYFGNTGGQQFVAKNGTGSPFPDQVGSAFDNYGVTSSAAICTSQFINTCTTNSTGAVVPVSLSLGGSANVVLNQLYLVQLQLALYTFNTSLSGLVQTANFFNTAAFNFTDLDGLTFESSSGEFLTAVPEPVTGLLLGLGLAGMGILRRSRSRRT